jgi:hypothetical protein
MTCKRAFLAHIHICILGTAYSFYYSSSLRKTLFETLNELSEHSTYNSLKQTLEEVKQADQDEYQLIVDCIKHKKLLTKLEENLKSEAVLFQQQEKVLDEQIYDLGNQLQVSLDAMYSLISLLNAV